MSEEQLEEICSELKMQNVHLSALVKHSLMPEKHEESDIDLSKEGTVIVLMQKNILRKLDRIEMLLVEHLCIEYREGYGTDLMKALLDEKVINSQR